jgi:hypothetical protein
LDEPGDRIESLKMFETPKEKGRREVKKEGRKERRKEGNNKKGRGKIFNISIPAEYMF